MRQKMSWKILMDYISMALNYEYHCSRISGDLYDIFLLEGTMVDFYADFREALRFFVFSFVLRGTFPDSLQFPFPYFENAYLCFRYHNASIFRTFHFYPFRTESLSLYRVHFYH